MVKPKRDVRPKRLAYFYLNGQLYKTKRVEKRTNMLYAYDARDHKLTGFLLSDVRALAQRAYSIGEAAKLLGCSHLTIRAYERQGKIRKAQRWHAELGDPGKRRYSEDHIREIREAMAETSKGRPRADGMIVPRETLPSAEELEAAFSGEDVLYEKVDGEFVPVWKVKF